MSGSGKGTFQPDSDVNISYDDQQTINKFARHNAKLDDLKDELKLKQNDLKNLEEAADELGLMDDTEKIPFLIGEIFICQDPEKTLKLVEDAKTKKEKEITDIEKNCEDLNNLLSDLKGHLYSKFGSHINLENNADE